MPGRDTSKNTGPMPGGGIPGANSTSKTSPPGTAKKQRTNLMQTFDLLRENPFTMTRQDRKEKFGFDCDDYIYIKGWQVGREEKKSITIKNTSLVSRKFNYKLPKTEIFDMEYPEGWVL